MPSIDRGAVPAVTLLVAGIAFVGVAFVLFPGAGDPAYVHSVEPVAESEVPDGADVLEYSGLSPEGQEAFRNALKAPDGEYVVRDEPEKPREFVYSDHAEVNRGIYFVRYRGEYSRLDTASGGGLDFLARWIGLVVGGLGAVLALVGGVSLDRGDERTPLAVWAGLGGATVLPLLVALFPGVVVDTSSSSPRRSPSSRSSHSRRTGTWVGRPGSPSVRSPARVDEGVLDGTSSLRPRDRLRRRRVTTGPRPAGGQGRPCRNCRRRS